MQYDYYLMMASPTRRTTQIYAPFNVKPPRAPRQLPLPTPYQQPYPLDLNSYYIRRHPQSSDGFQDQSF